jgi:homoserine O-succinyltransferase/O-acetyltransferase
MPLSLEARPARPSGGTPGRTGEGRPIVVALVNNMPDSALESTESQFGGLLQAAAGRLDLRLRLTSFPELPRSPEAQARITAAYWPIEEVLAAPPDALIVTGTEPRAARLADEPYWDRFVALLRYAEEHTLGSIWSCLAAHAAVHSLHGIERVRLAEKRCGVYPQETRAGHPLLAGTSIPFVMPHSRWNEIGAEVLRQHGYTLLSWSPTSGADTFVRDERGLALFFQGHPEYDDTTLLKEYRRDVGRYLNAQQPNYPTLPSGYLVEHATTLLAQFRARALAQRDPGLLASFPFAAVAAGLQNTWRPSAVALYRNWLAHIAAAQAATRAREPVSLARP